MEDAGTFYIWSIYFNFVYYVTIWNIFPFLVCCTKKNLATPSGTTLSRELSVRKWNWSVTTLFYEGKHCKIIQEPGLPDGMFSNQKYQFWKILVSLRVEKVDILYDHLEHITAIGYILWPFGNLVPIWYLCLPPFWFIVSRKIWQPWQELSSLFIRASFATEIYIPRYQNYLHTCKKAQLFLWQKSRLKAKCCADESETGLVAWPKGLWNNLRMCCFADSERRKLKRFYRQVSSKQNFYFLCS
jgi:hypothetical protein